jgi:hypothetical protein
LVRGGGAAAALDDGLLAAPPPLPEGLTPRWLRAEGFAAVGAAPPISPEETVWAPALYGRVYVRFDVLGVVVEERELHHLILPDADVDALTNEPAPAPTALHDAWLARTPPPVGRYAPLPGWLADASRVDALTAAWVAAARAAPGPDEAPQAESDDVRLLGVAVVWIPA